MQMVIAGLVAVLFAVIAGVLYLNKGGTTEVLTVSSALPPGHAIAKSDLATTEAAGVDGSYSVDQVNSIIGKTTTVGLVKGQVLTQGDLASTPLPAPSQRIVSVGLPAARVPATLSPGTMVNVLQVTSSTGGGVPSKTASAGPQVLATNAEVYQVSNASDGSSVVTLIVAAADANSVAAAGAAGQVTVVQVPATGQVGG